MAVPWPDSSPADSRKVPVAAPWKFSFVGRQFVMTGTCDFREFCGLKAIGDIGNQSDLVSKADFVSSVI